MKFSIFFLLTLILSSCASNSSEIELTPTSSEILEANYNCDEEA